MQPDELLKTIRKEYFEQISESDKFYKFLDATIGKDGGVRIYYEGLDQPLRHFPVMLAIFITTIYKRLFVLLIENIEKMSLFKKIITLISLQYNISIFPKWFEYLFENSRVLLKDQHYCQPAKETRRVFKKYFPLGIVDAIGMIIEYDTAYCYRLQDIIVLYRRENKIRKEIIRLIEVIIARETNERMKEKWQKIKKIANILLLIPKIKNLCKNILDDFNFEEMQFSKEDLYFINKFTGYHYLGKN